MKTLIFFFSLSLFPIFSHAEDACPATENSGFIKIRDKFERNIFWKRIPTRKQKQGTVFYLAGGPISHVPYINMARAYQKLVLPNYDFVLYDYYGINCSDRAQDLQRLPQIAEYFTVQSMSKDFLALKHELVGTIEKVIIFGGSHGAMVGSQIISDFPQEIDKAVLYYGTPTSYWLEDGYIHFDAILGQFANKDLELKQIIDELISKAQTTQLSVEIENERIFITKEMLDIMLWFTCAQDSKALLNIKTILKKTLDGDAEWLTKGVYSYYGVLYPVEEEAPPSERTHVTNFNRCNVWYPKSLRDSTPAKQLNYLNTASLKNYWNELCRQYDILGEYSFNAIPATPTNTPVLVWLGGLDEFDPIKVQNGFHKLTTNLTFHLKENWSHDYGLDDNQGFLETVDMMNSFFKQQAINE